MHTLTLTMARHVHITINRFQTPKMSKPSPLLPMVDTHGLAVTITSALVIISIIPKRLFRCLMIQLSIRMSQLSGIKFN